MMNTLTKPPMATAEKQKASPKVRSPVVELHPSPQSTEAAVLHPNIAGAMTIEPFSKLLYGTLDFGGLVKTLEDSIVRLKQGDLSKIEANLFAQAQTLQGMFTYLSQRMLKQQCTEYLESCCRMALKAQDQSRRTLETLAQMKKPAVVIAQQANITQGPQQVNNNLSV